MTHACRALALVVLLGVVAHDAAATSGAVATEHRLAAEAGAATLAAGGSSADAAIAAAAAVCVVHASSCGIGGGGFALVWRAGAAHALDFRETAPAATRPELYRAGGVAQPERTRTGGLAAGVPGEVAGWEALHRRFGRLPLRVVLEPAIRLARDGFPLADAPHLRAQIERAAPLLRADRGLAGIFLGGDAVPDVTFRVRQPDLARTLERIAADGRETFYEGRIGQAIVGAVAARGGTMTADDLRRYLPVWREPVRSTFAGRTVVAFPPPGSGAVVLTVLGIAGEPATIRRARESEPWPRLLAGALAQGFVDRARWYGDPSFTAVPTGTLLAPARLARLRREILDGGVRPDAAALRDAGTAHVSVMDGDGDAVSLTTTINTAFGSGILVPGTGIVLNNQMDDFVVAPGATNVYGLGGGAPNFVAGGKRPQSSMSPTIVVRDGKPELVVGGSGGPFIVSATAQVVLGVLAFGRSVPDAVAAPRLHDQGTGTVLVEPGIPDATRAALGAGDRKVVEFPALGAAAAVGVVDGRLTAAGDPRKDGGGLVVP